MKSDPDGRYRAELTPGRSIRLSAYPPDEGAEAYLMWATTLIPGEKVATTTDVALPKGVVVRGRVVEAGSGKPVAGAIVTHQGQSANNPYYIEGAAAWLNGTEQKGKTGADGAFSLAVMPGPGYLLVRGPNDDFLHEEISQVDLSGQLIWPNTKHYPAALKKLSPKPDEGPVEVEMTLRRGATVSGPVTGEDGQAVEKAVLLSRWYVPSETMTINFGQQTLPVRGGRFELHGCDPDSKAPVLLLDVAGRRGAALELSGSQAGKDVPVTLQPCGSATVRFVDGDGKALAAGRSPAHLEVVLSPGASFADLIPSAVNANRESPLMADAIMASNLDRERYNALKTDAEGRMTFPTLIPGATYRVIVFNQEVKTQIEFTVKPGEAKDLGDLTIRNPDGEG